MRKHNASHKSQRKGFFERLDSYEVLWKSWTECDICGKIDFSKGIEFSPERKQTEVK